MCRTSVGGVRETDAGGTTVPDASKPIVREGLGGFQMGAQRPDWPAYGCAGGVSADAQFN